MDRKQVEQSLIKLFVLKTLKALPKDENQKEWRVRFEYINLQPYCWICKQWRDDTSYDYCEECGCDFYSHMDLKNKELAPIRRSRCSGCYFQGSLNGQLKCQECFYRDVEQEEKADSIHQKRQAAVDKVKKCQEIKALEDLKKKRQYMFAFSMLDFVPNNTNFQIKPFMIQWAKDPSIPIRMKIELNKKIAEKYKQEFKKEGITF